jgi:hypothetical protein
MGEITTQKSSHTIQAVSDRRREAATTRTHAEAGLALAREHGFPFWTALGSILRGWALTEQEQPGDGIALMRQGLAALRATGSEVAVANFVALLANGYLRTGQTADGVTLIAETRRGGRATSIGPSWSGSRANCCCGRATREAAIGGLRPDARRTMPTPKPVFTEPSTARAESTRTRWSCARR